MNRSQSTYRVPTYELNTAEHLGNKSELQLKTWEEVDAENSLAEHNRGT